MNNKIVHKLVILFAFIFLFSFLGYSGLLQLSKVDQRTDGGFIPTSRFYTDPYAFNYPDPSI